MNNRGYAMDWNGPPITYVSQRPEFITYTRRSRDYSETSSSTTYRDKYTVEDPPDGSIRSWLVVLGAAILHICSELVYFMFFNTIVIAERRNLRLFLENVPTKDTYMEFMVFEDVRLMGEIIAAVASVFIGYRVVAAFGSVCVLGGFLGASFVDPSEQIELMGFLVGFLGGIGVSFWRFAAFVAVMEYFTRHRMTALILSGFGRVIGILIGYGILSKPIKDINDPNMSIQDIQAMTEWPTYFQCQAVMAGVGFMASLLLKPLSLVKARRGHEISWCLRIQDSSVCRGGMLFLVIAVYFLYYLGESLPMTTMVGYIQYAKNFSTDHTLGTFFAMACGVLLGYLLLPFWPLKKRLYSTLLWLGLFCLLMGLLTLQLPAFYQISYIATYCILVSAAQVMFETVLRYVIPIAFGRQYIRWIEGLLGFFAGGATIANNFIAKELVKEEGGVDNVYYFAGSAFLGAGLLAIIVIQIAICLKFKDQNRENERVMRPVYDVNDDREYGRKPSHLGRSRRDPSPPRDHYGYTYR